MNLAVSAAELRLQEIARIKAALVPRIEALRSMTAPEFRTVIALMLQSFGHRIETDPDIADFVTTKNGKKFFIACAPPAQITPTGMNDLGPLHQAVLNTNAERGFFITTRSFTEQAEKFAETTLLDLIDGRWLIKILNQSKKHVLMPQIYRAMCCQCGDIVQHRLDRDQDKAQPCANGHMVPPTIARAMLLPPRRDGWKPGDEANKPAPRIHSRREVRAHNYKYEARMMKAPRQR